MPHWAELDADNVVLRVIVADADDGADGTIHAPAFCTEVLGGTWQRTYYATEGHTYAGVGYTWDATAGDFVPPKVVDASDPDLVNEALVNPELAPPGG